MNCHLSSSPLRALCSDTPTLRFGSSPGSGTSRQRSRSRRLCKRLNAFVRSMVFTGTNTRCSRGCSKGDELDGPRKDQTLLYSDTRPGSQAADLEKMGHHRSMTESVAVLPQSGIHSPTARTSPTNSIWFNLAKGSNKNRSSKEYLELLVAELEAEQAMHSLPVQNSEFQLIT